MPHGKAYVVIASGGEYDEAWSDPVKVCLIEGPLLSYVAGLESERDEKKALYDAFHAGLKIWDTANPYPDPLPFEELPRLEVPSWSGIKGADITDAMRAAKQTIKDRNLLIHDENGRRRAMANVPRDEYWDRRRAKQEKIAVGLGLSSSSEIPDYRSFDIEWSIVLIDLIES
jgi:hypothetical protein